MTGEMKFVPQLRAKADRKLTDQILANGLSKDSQFMKFWTFCRR